MSITAKKLARKLNLSEAAVSMALNNKQGVSTKTRKMVLAAAEEAGYDFTRISGKNKNSGNIELVIYARHGAVVSDTPFFLELTESIQQCISEYRYKLNISHLFSGDDLKRQIEDLARPDTAGIILLGTEMTEEDFRPFSSLRIPLVLLDAYITDPEHDCILINNEQGAFIAADYLITKTKKTPGYLKSSYTIRNFTERADGFYRAIRAHGMSASKAIVHKLSPSIDDAFADMEELIASGEELAQAYFADNDNIAIGAIKALKQAGYRIPEDIAVIGFDNIPMSRYTDPALTTVNVPKKYMGQMAVNRLLEIMQAREFVPVKIAVNTNLVIRDSTP